MKTFTVSMVFLSITKMPSTLNPMRSPFSRLKNTFTYTHICPEEKCNEFICQAIKIERMNVNIHLRHLLLSLSSTRKPCYRKDTARCALHVDAVKKFGSPLLRPRLLFPKLLMTVVVIDRTQVHQMAHVGVSQSGGLKLFGREIIFEEFQPM